MPKNDAFWDSQGFTTICGSVANRRQNRDSVMGLKLKAVRAKQIHCSMHKTNLILF